MLPVARPSFTEEDIAEIQARVGDVLRSGWLTTGRHAEALEAEMARVTGSRRCVATNSCTSALHAILMALGIGPGDEVVVPSNTFSATANAVLHVGARPVFADSLLDTFNVDPASVRGVLSWRTKAVVAVNVGGNPAALGELQELTDRLGMALVQDAAHSLGSLCAGGRTTRFGVASAFSLSPTKVITAGEGGFAATDDEALADALMAIRNNGRRVSGSSDVVALGHNFKLSDVHAVIALSQAKHLASFLQLRQEIADVYASLLPGWAAPQLVAAADRSANYAYIVRVSPPARRDVVAERLKAKGVETSIYFRPLHLMPFFRGVRRLPVAERLGREVLGLPMGNTMDPKDAATVTDAMRVAPEAAAPG